VSKPETETIDFAVLLRDEQLSKDAGPALWAALSEARDLYRLSFPKLAGRDHYLATLIPPGIEDKPGSVLHPFGEAGWAKELRSTRNTRLYDQTAITRFVESFIKPEPKSQLVILTDLEIVPPKSWNYIIWDQPKDAVVLSLAPLDPRYWNEPDSDRVRTIKRRLRTSCCAIVGETLGLDPCHNPICFLFRPIDSVVQLDAMRSIGREHDNAALAGREFKATEAPFQIESILKNARLLEL
jgi:hypothetical protein